MANDTSKIDDNRRHTLMGVTDDANKELKNLLVDSTTGRLKVTGIISSDIGDLDDVTISEVADNDILQYDSASETWKNEPLGAGDVTGPASAEDNNIATFDETTGKLIQDGGKTIAEVLDRANHTGTQTASTISDFDTEVSNNTDVTNNTSFRTTPSGVITAGIMIDWDSNTLNVNKATGAEINTGTEDGKAVTPKAIADSNLAFTSDIPSNASASDLNTGTDTTKFATADALAGANIGKRIMTAKVFADDTELATGDGKVIMVIPVELNGMNLTQAEAMVSTTSSSGNPTIQIRNVTDSVDMLSTRITIDSTEYTSYTAETRSVVDGTKDDVVTGDRIAIDVDVAGTGAKGLQVILTFNLP